MQNFFYQPSITLDIRTQTKQTKILLLYTKKNKISSIIGNPNGKHFINIITCNSRDLFTKKSSDSSTISLKKGT